MATNITEARMKNMIRAKILKQKYPDHVVVFKVDDKYETYANDARFMRNMLQMEEDDSSVFVFESQKLDEYVQKILKNNKHIAVLDDVEIQ